MCSTSTAPSYSGTTAAFGTAVAADKSGALQVTASTPIPTSKASGKPGWHLVEVPVQASVATNGTFAVTAGQFVLVDPAGRACSQPQINPLSGGFAALTVDEGHPGTGRLAFQVPSSVDASALRVRYLAAPGAGGAAAQWSASGAAASSSSGTATACDGKDEHYTDDDADRQAFGAASTSGDKTVSTQVTAYTPTRRAFTPGSKQPNDVDAIDVKVKVSAHGADAYVDRRTFLLLDDEGRQCRFSASGSQGENLTTALVAKGKSKTFHLAFWVAKGSTVKGFKLLQVRTASSTSFTALWSGKVTLPPLG